MELSIIKQIKNKAGKILENQLLNTGSVLDIRHWELSGLIEIDLHLPSVDMQNWKQIPYIKFRVDGFSFRDYSPFGWDLETSTCSILVDSAHQGPGSRWAGNLIVGDTVFYFRPESTRQSPHPTDCVVGLGDASSVGHLLALQQLTVPVSRFDMAVILDSPQSDLLRDTFSPVLNILSNYDELAGWLVKQQYSIANTSFYVNGNNELVVALRRLLKKMGYSQIRVKGFWS
jgi:NADPH-dependent ferric siderophore reductase